MPLGLASLIPSILVIEIVGVSIDAIAGSALSEGITVDMTPEQARNNPGIEPSRSYRQ